MVIQQVIGDDISASSALEWLADVQMQLCRCCGLTDYLTGALRANREVSNARAVIEDERRIAGAVRAAPC